MLASSDWLAELGEARVSFLERNPVDGEQERRVLFASGLDADFSFVQARRLRLLAFALGPMGRLAPPSQRRDARVGARALATIIRPGYRILLDKDGLLERVVEIALAQPFPTLRERTLEEIASDFWYHAVWTAKKLRRGELWPAKGCCDAYLKDRVLEAFLLGRRQADDLPPARLADEALDGKTAKLLRESYGTYDSGGIGRALSATMDLFALVSRETSARLGLQLNAGEEEFARTEVARVLGY
jgi:aminoglycoside 6-adenylyltransferase